MDAILLASGLGVRFGNSIPKQFQKINNLSVLEISIIRLKKSNVINNILLVIHPDYKEEYLYLKKKYNLINIINGDSTRFLSLKLGLTYYKNFSTTSTNIIVCESVRPFYDITVIESLYRNINNFNCIVPVSKSVNTSVILAEENTILERENLYEMNTPIIYNFNKLCQYIDNSSLNTMEKLTQEVELFNKKEVEYYKLDEPIPKLTYGNDLFLFRKLFNKYSKEIIDETNIVVSVEESINLLRNKTPVIIYDKFNEQEGDLTIPSELIEPEILNTMLNHCKGVICQTLTKEVFERLELEMIKQHNFNNTCPSFLAPIDSIDIVSGISSVDRVLTIKSILHENKSKKDFIIPGHQNILKCADNLLVSRQGHTETSTALVKLAGFKPSAVICEVMDKQNVPMRESELLIFCNTFNFKMVYLHEIYNYYMNKQMESVKIIPSLSFHHNMDLNLFRNKIVLITGGSKGIGKSIYEMLTYKEAIVYDLSRTNDCDVSDYKNVESYIKSLNIDKIDILINNAGYCSLNAFNETSLEEWNKHINVNLNGVYNVTHCSMDLLKKSENPTIFNITSTAAVNPRGNWSAYCVSKTAISTLSSIIQEENPAFNIYEICPGRTKTDMRYKLFGKEDDSTLLTTDKISYIISYIYNEKIKGSRFIISPQTINK